MSNKPYEVEQELQRRAKQAYADITTPSDLAKRLRERTRHPRLVGDTRTIRLLEKAVALLDEREGYQLVPKEADMMVRKHLEGRTGVAFLDGYEAWLKALAAAKGEGQ